MSWLLDSGAPNWKILGAGGGLPNADTALVPPSVDIDDVDERNAFGSAFDDGLLKTPKFIVVDLMCGCPPDTLAKYVNQIKFFREIFINGQLVKRATLN